MPITDAQRRYTPLGRASRREPPADLSACEVKPAASRGRPETYYLFHRATGWLSRPLSKQEAFEALEKKDAPKP